jgi:superfamily II DNA/RNA helicase
MTFEELGIKPPLSEIPARRTIREASEIQKLVVPKLLDFLSSSETMRGLLFTSPTGTGKTFAYLLPLIQRYCIDGEAGHRERSPQIIILAPTHELCSQIRGEADFLLKEFPGLHSALLIGSVPLNRQIDSLKKSKPIIAVGNPSRILQLFNMKKLSLASLRCLVFDEGDRLAADELFPETAELAARAPQDCAFIACSATFSPKSRERLFSIKTRAGDDRTWETAAQTENDILKKNIEHWAFFAEERKKIRLFRSFLAASKPKKVLVFTSRPSQAGDIVAQLQYHHYAAAGLSGGMDKKARKAALDAFRKGNVRILVASDLASRGLDLENVSHIAALDVPDSEETYIHRAGRTARAGKRGIMASFGDERELRLLAKIEKRLGIIVYPKELYLGTVRAPVPEEAPDDRNNPCDDVEPIPHRKRRAPVR